MKNRINSVLHFARSDDLYPDLHVIEGAATPETMIEGRKMLMFSSNNYLGLSPKRLLAGEMHKRCPRAALFVASHLAYV